MTGRIYRGGCLCGRVRYEIKGAIEDIICCHCSECRKAQGSAYATNGNVKAEDFVVLTGESELTGYPSGSDQVKFFCRRCGSPIISKRRSVTDRVRVRLGSIDGDITQRPTAHIFVGSRANWDPLDAALPRFETHEPSRQQPPNRAAGRPGND